jgi:hypothetical protein
MMVFAIPGPDDPNNKKCGSKDYICYILRGTIMLSKFSRCFYARMLRQFLFLSM